MVAIQVRHLSIGLNPDLILCVGRNVVEGSDMELELSSLCKLAQACSERAQTVTSDGDGKIGDRFTDVIDTVSLHAEDVRVVRAVDEVGDVAPDISGELFEETFLFRVRNTPNNI